MSFIAPDDETLLDDRWIFSVTAPSWAWAAVGAFFVAWACVHAGVFVRSADRQASWVTIASEGAIVSGVSASRSALLPEIIMVWVLEALWVRLWNSFWAIAVSKVVPLRASAAKGAVSVAWTVSGAFLNVFVVAFVFTSSSCAA